MWVHTVIIIWPVKLYSLVQSALYHQKDVCMACSYFLLLVILWLTHRVIILNWYSLQDSDSLSPHDVSLMTITGVAAVRFIGDLVLLCRVTSPYLGCYEDPNDLSDVPSVYWRSRGCVAAVGFFDDRVIFLIDVIPVTETVIMSQIILWSTESIDDHQGLHMGCCCWFCIWSSGGFLDVFKLLPGTVIRSPVMGLARSWTLGVDDRTGCGERNGVTGLDSGDAEDGDTGGE
jgi:hypothetical protein